MIPFCIMSGNLCSRTARTLPSRQQMALYYKPMPEAQLLLALAAAYTLIMLAHLHNPSQGYVCDDLDSMPMAPKAALAVLASGSLASYLCSGQTATGQVLTCIPVLLFAGFVVVTSWHYYALHMSLVMLAFCGLMAILWLRSSGGGRRLAIVVIALTLLGSGAPAVLYHRTSVRAHDGRGGLYDVYEAPGKPVRVVQLARRGWADANRTGLARRHDERRTAILYQRVAVVFLLFGTGCVLLKTDGQAG